MILDKGTLQGGIKAALKEAAKTTDPNQQDASFDAFASKLADAVHSYVKTALETAKVTVVANTGDIQVAGSPSSQTNASPITLTGDPKAALKGGIN